MEQLNFDEVKQSSSSHFAVMPDGFIYQCKTGYFKEPCVGLFRRQSIGFVQGGWEFLVARGSVKELEKTEAYINKEFSVIADLIPRKDFPKKTRYGNTLIPNLNDFLTSDIAVDLFCAYLDKDDELDQIPIEITKDLYDYYVNDARIKREKIEYVDCILVWIGGYLPTSPDADMCEYGYAFTSKNGKFYCLGKMNEHAAKYYGNGSKLKEAVKEFNKNTNYDLTKAVETAKDRELESIKKKCEKLRLSEESAWKNAADLSLGLGGIKIKNRLLEQENADLRKYQHDSISREVAYAETVSKLRDKINELEILSSAKVHHNEQLKTWLHEANNRELTLDREVKTLKEQLEIKTSRTHSLLKRAQLAEYTRDRIDTEVSEFVTELKKSIYEKLDI